MKKIDAAIIGLIGLYSVSCRVCTYTQSENKSCMQFVEHLTVVDKILNDTILYGWCARRMRPEDDINAYHLLYDTGTWYRPYYLNYYRFDSADPIHKEDVVDTSLPTFSTVRQGFSWPKQLQFHFVSHHRALSDPIC